MEKENGEKIVQIVALNFPVFAVYQGEKKEEIFRDQILIAALVEARGLRWVRYAEISSDGEFGYPEEATNFLRFEIGGGK